MGDTLVFDNTNTQGSGAIAKVVSLKGKQVNSVSVATSSITGVEILPSPIKGEYILFADNPHNFKKFNRVLVTGLSTTSSNIGGSYQVGISSNRLTLVGVGTTSAGVGTAGATGIVTCFPVTIHLHHGEL